MPDDRVAVQLESKGGSDRTVAIRSLKEARTVDASVGKVIVLQEGRPPIILLRRVVGGDVQGLVGVDCTVGDNIRIPRNAVVACGSVIDGEIVVGEGAIVANSEIRGACQVDPFSFVNEAHIFGADRKISIQREMMLFCRE